MQALAEARRSRCRTAAAATSASQTAAGPAHPDRAVTDQAMQRRQPPTRSTRSSRSSAAASTRSAPRSRSSRQQGDRPHRRRGARRERSGEAEGRHRPDRQADLPDGRRQRRRRRTSPAGRVPPDDVVLPSERRLRAEPSGGQEARRSVTGEMLTNASQGFDQNGAPGIELPLQRRRAPSASPRSPPRTSASASPSSSTTR